MVHSDKYLIKTLLHGGLWSIWIRTGPNVCTGFLAASTDPSPYQLLRPGFIFDAAARLLTAYTAYFKPIRPTLQA